jgi:exopolyphosphatase/guanosine-5'-triphosphate,3'-diphosphate pyrophosphatase
MGEILARWEWRTFDQDLGPAERHLAALARERVQESEETYLLGADDDANVKVRGALMDIKILERVEENGLEQWRPVLKAPFPLDAAGMARLCTSLGAPSLVPTSPPPSLERVIAELTTAGATVHVVDVAKRRSRCRIGGCVAEVSEVVANGKRARTVAIEDEDPARVMAAVRSVELDRFPNTSYPRGLRRILGLPQAGPRR